MKQLLDEAEMRGIRTGSLANHAEMFEALAKFADESQADEGKIELSGFADKGHKSVGFVPFVVVGVRRPTA